MDKYDVIKNYQDGIYPAKLIRSICHTQDNKKQDAMNAVETKKQVYLFYQAPYHSNTVYMEVFKVHLKVSE